MNYIANNSTYPVASVSDGKLLPRVQLQNRWENGWEEAIEDGIDVAVYKDNNDENWKYGIANDMGNATRLFTTGLARMGVYN